MNKQDFINVLKAFGLSHDDVYEDLSETGTVLWHDNAKLSIKVVSVLDEQPSLQIVALRPDGDYLYFERELKQLNAVSVERLLQYAKNHGDSVYELAIKAKDVMVISAESGEWRFNCV